MHMSVLRKKKDEAMNYYGKENPQPSILTDKSLGIPISQAKTQPSLLPLNSIFSINRSREYFISLRVPNREQIQYIAAIQERKELEITKRLFDENSMLQNSHSRIFSDAALGEKNLIREQVAFGSHMSPTDRWVEAIRELCYRKLIWPYEPKNMKRILAKPNHSRNIDTICNGNESSTLKARRNWKKAGLIARRAGRDEKPGSEPVINNELEKGCIQLCITNQSTKEQLRKKAKLMDLQYFLEMVDPKHRYGPNLRIYHEEWKRVDSLDNFFQWLDFGEGLQISCQACPRERLERERVHYLSKEERSNYLIALDCKGRLCWAKNGTPVDTSKKSSDCIKEKIPPPDNTTRIQAITMEPSQDVLKYQEMKNLSMNSSSFISCIQKSLSKYKKNGKYANTTAYATTKLNRTPNAKIIRNISVATIIDRLLRGSVKKNTWIFVADTDFRIYVGMKQSGIFQHSSFLHGSRVSAAGSIKVIDGKLRGLSPLSGHYRTPVTNFRDFMRALKEAGVDTSQTSISRSYFILIGLETYFKARTVTMKHFDRLKKDKTESHKPRIPHPRKKKRQIIKNLGAETNQK
ncbi:putative iq calmodulin-binding motif protein [Erysiphe necator]|uniref:Putative iq calmodulin-binding motif protein n=1 Tax=Uncinula necator TaxID=52586 RepID=A0A0B1PFT0_UNCNE|nr:putative iq calmodulin-binding motif protein [Erysiphe necator]